MSFEIYGWQVESLPSYEDGEVHESLGLCPYCGDADCAKWDATVRYLTDEDA